MSWASRKLALVEAVLDVEDEDLLLKIESLLSISEVAQPMNLPVSTEEMLSRISQSEKDFEEGRYKTSKELMVKYVS